ncbi:MAG: Xaa-Pro peptidase family protein [archaeon]
MRLKEFQQKLAEKKLQGALLFSKDSNFFYFTQQKMDSGMLFIPARGKPTLFVNNLEHVLISVNKIIYTNPSKDLKSFFKKEKIQKIGVNNSSLTLKQKKVFCLGKTKDIGDIIQDLRMRKTDEEVSLMGKACSLTEETLKKIVSNFDFKTEKELRKFINVEAVKKGCDLSYEPIVAAHRNSTIIHYVGNKKITKGFLLIDMGFKYKGYCADITRMLYIGNPSNKELDSYNELLRIQRKVIDMIKPGIRISELENFVRKEMGEKEKYFVHSLGHSLGLVVHEKPVISRLVEDKLEEGMVITIEPGIYRRYGMRIEDDVLVTANGRRLLTKFPKELIIIPKF